MSKGYKGGDFEREICKLLSRWWTDGKRDDIYWRSSQSGGRATQRSKFGKTTYGSYGDIAAVDPVGEPLLKLFTIELKRGSSHGCPGDLLDFKNDNSRHPWMLCLKQAIRSHQQAKSVSWMLIARRDFRKAIVYLEARILKLLRNGNPLVTDCIVIRMTAAGYTFVGLPLEVFLSSIKPAEIIRVLNDEH